jgi:hypothetical protein
MQFSPGGRHSSLGECRANYTRRQALLLKESPDNRP